MEYEVVELSEKTVVGVCAKTKNTDPNMQNIIGELWKTFLGHGVYQSIPNKVSCRGFGIGLYDAYESDVNGTYDVTIGAEVSTSFEGSRDESIPKGCIVKQIPAGKYAKFKLQGDVHKVVGEFWSDFWKREDVQRSYKADFEEYVSGTMDNCEINIYISI